jgi:phosphoglycerol transferase MdoB-like AlkP superfamily enzyme
MPASFVEKANITRLQYFLYRRWGCLARFGAFAKGLLIAFCVSYLLVVIELFLMELTALALFMLAMFLTVFFVVLRGYARRKTEAPV